MTGYTLSFDHFIAFREHRGKLKPMFNSECWFDGRSANVMVLLDSGADNLVLPTRILEYLGISIADLDSTVGRTTYGIQEGYIGPLVRFTLPDLDLDWGFISQPIFSPVFDTFGYGLLGREPAFEHFRHAFDHRLGEGTLMTLY